jgi:hypothetical protein
MPAPTPTPTPEPEPELELQPVAAEPEAQAQAQQQPQPLSSSAADGAKGVTPAEAACTATPGLEAETGQQQQQQQQPLEPLEPLEPPHPKPAVGDGEPEPTTTPGEGEVKAAMDSEPASARPAVPRRRADGEVSRPVAADKTSILETRLSNSPVHGRNYLQVESPGSGMVHM